MRRTRRLIRKRPAGGGFILVQAILVWLGCWIFLSAQGNPQWQGMITKEGDVIVVRNPKEPIYQGEVLSLKEDLAIPAAGPKDQYLLSAPRQVCIDGQGNMYVLDRKSSDIKLFDVAGKYIRTIGRKGQGPGELDLPSQISINDAKKEICVLQASRRISFFSFDGAFLRNLSTATSWALGGIADSTGCIVLTEGVVAPPNSSYVIKKFDPEMKLIAELGRSPAPTPLAFDPFLPIARWTIDDDDNVIYGYPKTYEILVFGPHNKIIRKIRREFDPIRVSDAEIEEAKKSLSEGMTPNFSKFHSAFRGLSVDDEGRIYIQTWRQDDRGKLTGYDLFDKEGKYLAVLNLKEGALIRKGKMYAIEEDEDGYQTIKRYALTWNLK